MSEAQTIGQQLAKTAHALRPVRIVNGEAIHYTATTFPKDPWAGCEHTLRVAHVTGDLGQPGGTLGGLWVDVLNENGDIIQEWPMGRKCFEHLRRKLKFVREPAVRRTSPFFKLARKRNKC